MLDEVECTGTEPSLANCTSLGWLKSRCRHSQDASAVCTNGEPRGTHALRNKFPWDAPWPRGDRTTSRTHPAQQRFQTPHRPPVERLAEAVSPGPNRPEPRATCLLLL